MSTGRSAEEGCPASSLKPYLSLTLALECIVSSWRHCAEGLPDDASDKEEVRCFFELKFGKVVDAVLAKNDGILLTLHRRRGQLSMHFDGLHARFIRTNRGERRMQKFEQKLEALDQRIRQLKRQKFFKTKLAFVTFSEEASYVKCLDASPRGWVARLFMKPEDQFRGMFPYTVTPAPAPSDVMFENLDVSETSRFWRRCAIGLVTLTLLVVSFSTIAFLATEKRRLLTSTDMNEEALALAIGGPGGGVFGTNASRLLASPTFGGVTLPEDFKGTDAFESVCRAELAACEVTYSEPGLLTLMSWGSFLTLMPVSDAMSATEKGVKVKTVVKEIADCGVTQERCSPARAEAADRRGCHACYCAGLTYHTITTTAIHAGGERSVDSFSDLQLSTLREQCDGFLEKPAFGDTVLIVATITAVTIINALLKVVIKSISAFERHVSFISLQSNIAEKVFMAQFLNTAVLLIVVNAAIPELTRGISSPFVRDVLFHGNHRDFDQMWYKDIGGPLMITMLINTMAPIATLFGLELIAAFSRCWGRCTAWTQKRLDDAYTAGIHVLSC
jgi:hypothetical protein